MGNLNVKEPNLDEKIIEQYGLSALPGKLSSSSRRSIVAPRSGVEEMLRERISSVGTFHSLPVILPNKILFVGAAETGKSTLFTQMVLTKGGSTPLELTRIKQNWILRIFEIFVHVFSHLDTRMDKLDVKEMEDLRRIFDKHCVDSESFSNREHLRKLQTAYQQNLKADSMGRALNQVLLKSTSREEFLIALSNLPVIQDALAMEMETDTRCLKLGLIRYFREILNEDYTATEKHILELGPGSDDSQMAVLTMPTLAPENLTLVDAGGRRGIRYQWNTFDDLTGIFFTIALDDYNKTLAEEPRRNRMKESLLLFQNTAASCRDLQLFVFLTKFDKFQSLVKAVDMKCCFPNYMGGHDVGAALDFVMELVERMAKYRSDIEIHVVNALNRDEVAKLVPQIETAISEYITSTG